MVCNRCLHNIVDFGQYSLKKKRPPHAVAYEGLKEKENLQFLAVVLMVEDQVTRHVPD